MTHLTNTLNIKSYNFEMKYFWSKTVRVLLRMNLLIHRNFSIQIQISKELIITATAIIKRFHFIEITQANFTRNPQRSSECPSW